SQFTLLASTDKGNKPSFHKSANGETARKLYDAFYSKIESLYTPDKVRNGVFQAMMDVGLVNDGPVTIEINTDPPKMDNPTGFEANGDGGTLKTKIHKTFTLPAELLE
ncbi:D-tyrosyl-tRNA(Tyr) deacylase, partial [Cryomyces antarcticus]